MAARLFEIPPGLQIQLCPRCGARIVRVPQSVFTSRKSGAAQTVFVTVTYRSGEFPQQGEEHICSTSTEQLSPPE